MGLVDPMFVNLAESCLGALGGSFSLGRPLAAIEEFSVELVTFKGCVGF